MSPDLRSMLGVLLEPAPVLAHRRIRSAMLFAASFRLAGGNWIFGAQAEDTQPSHPHGEGRLFYITQPWPNRKLLGAQIVGFVSRSQLASPVRPVHPPSLLAELDPDPMPRGRVIAQYLADTPTALRCVRKWVRVVITDDYEHILDVVAQADAILAERAIEAALSPALAHVCMNRARELF